MFATISSFILVLLVGIVGQIPNEPDFSGQWVLVEAAGTGSNMAPSLTVRQTMTRTTMRGEPMTPWFSDFMMERHFRNGVVASESYKIGTIGGTVSATATPASAPGREERTTVGVTWEGKSLIIRTGKYAGQPHEPPYTEHGEVWSIDPGGRLLITITDRASGSRTATVTLIYRRQRP